MSNSPFTITLSNTQADLVATGDGGFATAAPIVAVGNIVTGSGGLILPAYDPTSYVGDESRTVQQITLASQAGTDISVYLPNGTLRCMLRVGSSIRLEGLDTWAEILLYGNL
jgi:hypothetical protein